MRSSQSRWFNRDNSTFPCDTTVKLSKFDEFCEVSVSKAGQFELYDLRVTVERIEGRSVCGLQPGDYFELTESSKVRIPDGRHFCLYALQAVLPLLPPKQRILDDNDWLERDTLVACPDPEERLIMRVERIGRRTLRTDDLT